MAKRTPVGDMSIDMTPMIDMTFQLIAFFMILINFSEGEQNEMVTLPGSTLAKPPDAPLETPITIQIGFLLDTKGNPISSEKMFVAGQTFDAPDSLKPVLNNEKFVLQNRHKDVTSANIIIRAHKDCKTGIVQNVIRVCQEVGFDKFTLRAKEQR